VCERERERERERDFYGVVWLEGCKIRADQSSLKLGLQNKVVTIGPLKRDYKVVRMFI
jgi:hypothetical protein